MMVTDFVENEGFDSAESRKKRLGQYFSGAPVSRLLVALASIRKTKSVLDPMAGRGDMLLAAQLSIPGNVRLDGIELDPRAHTEGSLSIKDKPGSKSSYLLGNAFDPTIVSKVRSGGYDLVITNPPYVRYQSLKESAGIDSKLPNAIEVRKGLQECIKRMTALNTADKAAFLSLAEGYSGLSDLAVPSWILCAALVKPGGTLAMVVPDSWMKRDYASSIRYMLLRWFRIEFVVEDTHASWFKSAQIKTNMLVARRIKGKASIRNWSAESYIQISLPSNLATLDSLVGKSRFASSSEPERAFARQAQDLLNVESTELETGIDYQRILMADQAATVIQMAANEPWFANLEPHSRKENPSYILPPPLASLMAGSCTFRTLNELGMQVGQGLRTGANDFFYVTRAATKKGNCEVVLSKLFLGESIIFPSSCLMPVVRNQSDVAKVSITIEVESITGAVLALQEWALPEDSMGTGFKVLPTEAASHIRRAAETTVTHGLIPSLSAVKTNIRSANPRIASQPRFWYMLPDFAPRHSPDLFVARVNNKTPRVLLNPNRESLVDANFSTLWLRSDTSIPATAFLAYLNSSMAAAFYEHLGAVMGGGALKLEATHLRTMPIPDFDEPTWMRIAELGAKLGKASAVKQVNLLEEIDDIVCAGVFGADSFKEKLHTLQLIVSERQSARTRN